MRFNLLSKPVFIFSMTEDMQNFFNFADHEQFKIDSHLADFLQAKIDPTRLFLLTLGSTLTTILLRLDRILDP